MKPTTYPTSVVSHEPLVIQDNVHGEIILPWQFRIFILLDEIQALKHKTQLGMTKRNPVFTGGKHTRFEHAIGATKVGQILVENIKKSFKQYFTISNQYEMAFYISAFFHDSGHGPGSHAFEKVSKISHEEETLRIVDKYRDLFDSLFGEGTCDIVLTILTKKNQIKKEHGGDDSSKVDLLFVLSTLMASGIDIDRVDYLMRDALNIYGKFEDFTVIFQYMHLELVNDHPAVVFDKRCVPILQSYFITRFNQYCYVYQLPSTVILDEYYYKFMVNCVPSEMVCAQTSETYIDYLINHENFTQDPEKKWYATVLSNGGSEEIEYKVFSKDSALSSFKLLLGGIVELREFFFGIVQRKTVIYDKKKNAVLIKNDNEVIDFSEAQQVIRDNVSSVINVVYVDTFLLRLFLREKRIEASVIDKIIKKIHKLFHASLTEIEKKYIIDPQIDIPTLTSLLLSQSTLLSTSKKINKDTYYFEKGVFEPKDGSVRLRYEGGKQEPTIKLPLPDSTSITKRKEFAIPQTFKQESDFLHFADSFLQANGFPTHLSQNATKLEIVTDRQLIKIQYMNAILEIAFDISHFTIQGETTDVVMVEIELKQDPTIALWYITNLLLSNYGTYLTECHISKLMIGYNLLTGNQ